MTRTHPHPPGRLIAVVGPSGVGKDSVMAGIVAAAPQIRLIRRVITRPADPGGENHEPASIPEFQTRARRGEFCLHWCAHSLFYGLPADALTATQHGTDCIANLSRGTLARAASVFPSLVVLNLTAELETLARRLALRGRESDADIAARLSKVAIPVPTGLTTFTVTNDGPLSDTIASALTALQPVKA